MVDPTDFMASITLLVLCSVLALIPLCSCAIAARADAIRRERRFGQRIFFSALFDVLLFMGFAVASLALLLRQDRPPNVYIGIAWIQVIFGCGFVFLVAAFTGAIGYAVSYRVFEQSAAHESYERNEPESRIDETGNPYQPPNL